MKIKSHNIVVVLTALGFSGMAALSSAQTNDFGDFGHRQGPFGDGRNFGASYLQAIEKTAMMVNDSEARNLANRHGLDLLDLTWEDTGRYKGSSVGPNISDMTIQVDEPAMTQVYPPRIVGRLMPVFRFPNFSDKTGDMDSEDITLLVGNESHQPLRRVSLSDYLQDIGVYLNPGRGRVASLRSDRDDKVLASAQACFLPVPLQGKATFNPVVYNYQSSYRNPAVLAILATREGTSAQVVEDQQGGSSSWGQKIFFNNFGQKAAFTGERLTDFKQHGGDRSQHTSPVNDAALNMVMLIQVPLVHQEPRYHALSDSAPTQGAGGFGGGATATKALRRGGSDVENAVVGHGRNEGPFNDLDGLHIQRDTRFPIRVTVQFYKATSNGIVNDADVAQMKHDIDRVYDHAENVGSLVTEGDTGRPTEYIGIKVQPHWWWSNFWDRYDRLNLDTRDQAIGRLRELLGRNYEAQPVTDLYLRNLLRNRR